MRQKTLDSPVICSGIGIHTGQISKLEILPAEEDSGIVFVKDGIKVSALAANVTGTSRGTSLSGISTVEHLLSAINGLGITNAVISIEGDEPPIFDGSSKEYVALFKSAGIHTQDKDTKRISPSDKIIVGDANSFVSIEPSDRLIVEATIDYADKFIGKQTALFDSSKDDYGNNVAPARTFGHMSELKALQEAGLAKGASAENAIAILDNGFSSPLRFPDELARHKILDIIGDIALAGMPVIGKISSYRAGHRLNIELVRRLLNARSRY
jgi:UDP-3-O-[3-hydroxymyristoyl] N-acetylglucosamine deacetylase